MTGIIKETDDCIMDNITKPGACPYCGGPNKCKDCGITCIDAGGLTPEGLCALCATNKPIDIKAQHGWNPDNY